MTAGPAADHPAVRAMLEADGPEAAAAAVLGWAAEKLGDRITTWPLEARHLGDMVIGMLAGLSDEVGAVQVDRA